MRIRRDFTFDNYIETWQKYADVIGETIIIALATAVVTTVIAFAFAYLIRFRAGRFGLPLLFITLLTLFGGYLVKIYAWKAILGREGDAQLGAAGAVGLIDEPLTIFIYNSGAVIATADAFPAAAGGAADLRIAPRRGGRSDRGGQGPRRSAASGVSRYGPAALPAGNSDRLHALVPDRRRRLCDAALRRRHGHGDDRRFHRAAILPALRLADGQRHVLQHAGGVSPGDRPGGSRIARRRLRR